jgi:hypothetical protein
MASSGKKKTTMAKLTRESRLRERRLDKKARKDARKLAAANGTSDLGPMPEDLFGDETPDQETPAQETRAQETPAEETVAEETLAESAG